MRGLPRNLGESKFLGWGLFVAAILLFAAWGPSLLQSPHPGFSTAESIASTGAGPVWEDAIAQVERLRLQPGQQLVHALLDAEVEPEDVGAALGGFGDVLDVRRIRPSDTFWVYRTREGALTRLEYERSGSRERVVVNRESEGFLASVEEKTVEHFLRKIEGTVEDNLFLAITRGGGSSGLVMNFADLFAWDFDFFTDTRQGDRFEMLVEEEVVDGEPAGFSQILAARYVPVRSEEPLQAFHYGWNEGRESGYYTADGKSIKKFFLKSPLNYRRISSHFTKSRFHPILKKYRPHLGIDYAAPMGTPVVALGNGKVLVATTKGGYGRTVQIRHNKSYMTQYAHLSRYGKGIRSGVRVKQGQIIGYVGSSGLSTGPHLDFRVQKDGRWVNPLNLKGGRSEPLPKSERADFAQDVERMDLLLEKLTVGFAVPLESGDGQGLSLALARLDTPATS